MYCGARRHRAACNRQRKLSILGPSGNVDLLRCLLIKFGLEWGEWWLTELCPQAINIPFGNSVFPFLEGLDLLPKFCASVMCTVDEDGLRRRRRGKRHALSCDGRFEEIHLWGKVKAM